MKPKYLIIAFLPIEIIIFHWISAHPIWIEDFYIPFVFKPLTQLLGSCFGVFKYSLGLILNYFLVFLAIFWVLFNLKKIFTRSFFINSICFSSVFYFLFMIFWGLCYQRIPLEKRHALNTQNISKEELIQLCNISIQNANQERAKIKSDTLNFSDLNIISDAIKCYKSEGLNKHPSVKMANFSDVLSYLSTAGMYNFFSGEANINKNLLQFEKPFVACHEMAHQSGEALEDDASFVSYQKCINNPNSLFRYSANAEIVFRSLRILSKTDSLAAKKLYESLSPAVLNDHQISKKRWAKYHNPFEKYISRIIYDWFLISNGQNEGIASYDRVVDLVIANERKIKLKKVNYFLENK